MDFEIVRDELPHSMRVMEAKVQQDENPYLP
jgi:hypothetical protein